MDLEQIEVKGSGKDRTRYRDIPLAIAWRLICTFKPDKAYTGRYLDWYNRTVDSVTGRTEHAYELANLISQMDIPQVPTNGKTLTTRVLELAPGSGRITIPIARGYPEWDFLACDYSHDSIVRLQQELQEEGIDNVDALTGDFHRLPIAPESMSLVMNVGGYRHVINPDEFWGEVSRVTAKGGLVVVSNFHPPRFFSIFGELFNNNPTSKDIEEDSNGFGFEIIETKKIRSSYPKLDIPIPGTKGFYDVSILRKL